MKKIRLAVIGLGHLGSRHLRVYSELNPAVELIAACDVNPEAEQHARTYKIPFTQDYKTLAGKVDAVSICAPTSKHFEVAEFFLSHKVHTLVEKPITNTIKEADTLIKLADQHNVKLQVGHVERFNSAFASISAMAKEPLFIECHRLNRFPNRSLDIGVVMDLMIHDIDIILGLVRSPIKSLEAIGVPVLTPHEDIANTRIVFANGCVCNLTASRISDEVTRKIRIFQKDAYISLNYVAQEAFIYKKHHGQILKHALPIEKEEPLKKELESFIECIGSGQKPLVSGVEGRDALKVALDVISSIQSNPMYKGVICP